MALDALKRRSRSKPQATDGIGFVSDRDLLWFEKMHRHGPLPTNYLLAYSEHLKMNEKKAQKRLTSLYHEDDTPHGGRYMERPWQQRATPIRNQGVVHDIRPPALEALKHSNRFRPHAPAPAKGMWFLHDLMLATLTSSIELACLKSKTHEYIFHDEICDKIGHQLAFDVNKKLLKPDRAFGIKSKDGATLFLVEADRTTETHSIYMEKMRQYQTFIGDGYYKDALRIKSGVLLINLMTSETHMRNVMHKLDPNTYMLFKALPIFGREFITPPVMTDLFSTAWERVGKEPYFLNK